MKFFLTDHINSCTVQIINRCAKSCNPMPIKSSGLKCRRHLGRMMHVISIHATSSTQKRTNFHTFPNIKPSGSLRSKQTFMSCEAQYINPKFLHINWINTCCLRSIHNKQNMLLRCNLSYPFQIDHISCQIRSMRTHNCFCVVPHRILHLFI